MLWPRSILGACYLRSSVLPPTTHRLSMGPAQPKSDWNTQSDAVQCVHLMFHCTYCNEFWKTTSLTLQTTQTTRNNLRESKYCRNTASSGLFIRWENTLKARLYVGWYWQRKSRIWLDSVQWTHFLSRAGQLLRARGLSRFSWVLTLPKSDASSTLLECVDWRLVWCQK